MKKYCCFFLLLFTFFGNAQNLRLEDIMKGDEFIGHQPDNHRWSIDGQTVLFDWNPNNEIDNSTYFWNKTSKSPQKVTTSNPIYDLDFMANPIARNCIPCPQRNSPYIIYSFNKTFFPSFILIGIFVRITTHQ